MEAPYFTFLSKMDRESQLFKECLKTLSLINPKDWPRERIIAAVDVLHYDCLIYTDGKKLIGANAFNPDRKEGVAKSFLLFVSSEYRGKGIAKALRAEFLKWAQQSGFKGAQLGLGNNPAGVAVSEAVKRERKKLGLTFANINPATGKVTFTRPLKH